ncbi:uncharacterized protein LOC127866369 isoform X2 [Dreissena polymorpha]|uniref:uncharacterized protein LOC127866369 isoform X2 n=1 Tax=Dreissena polymorpha TaxID=45954 RepID=UPI0022653BA4|nr:uncharacterized protein LOC127866369 isoform X2 [Dreissena polymorpha]
MDLHTCILIVTALLFSCFTDAFRIRRSGVAGYDDPYGLTNAFEEIERPTRNGYESLLRAKVLEEDDPYFNPNEDNLRRMNVEPLVEDTYNYVSPYEYGKSFPQFSSLEQIPDPYEGLNGRMFGPQKRTVHNPRRVVPTLQELQTIFGGADVPMKRLPIKRQEPAKDTKSESKATEPKLSEKSQFDKENREEAFRKLLSVAQNLKPAGETNEQAHSENEEKAVTVKQSKTTVIESKTHEKLTEHDTNESSQKVELIDSDDSLNSKSKRASEINLPPKLVAELLEQINILKEKVSKLEVLQMLEERENDYLANALKFATLDQIEGRDDFVNKEFDDINKATETEAMIQSLTEDKPDEVDGDDVKLESQPQTDISNIVLPELEQKRTPEVEVGQGLSVQDTWLEEPVQEHVSDGAMLEEHAAANDELATKDMPGGIALEVPVVADNPLNDSPIVERKLLRELLGSLSPSTIHNIIKDLGKEALTGVCPAVDEVSEKCAFVDAGNIPLDEEAQNLCIRHQVCYTCGSALGIPKSNCDDGYKGTVIEECEGDTSCLRDAAYFLQLMAQAHVYKAHSPEACASSCVRDFIVGIDE